MRIKKPFWFILSLSLVVAFGCSVFTGPAAPETPEGDRVATAVAQTLAANPTIVEVTAPPAAPTTTPTTPAAEPTLPAPGGAIIESLSIAYLDASRNLWIWREGEPARQLTTSGDIQGVHLSPDGQWLAFTRSAMLPQESLWVMRADGSGERVVLDEAGFEDMPRLSGAITSQAFYFAWLPGSATLAFNTMPVFDGPGLMLNDDLWLANAETGELRQLLAPGSGGMFYPSPDGTQIVLVTPSTISLINTDGSNRRDSVLTYERVSTYSEYAYYAAPQWSADSSYLRVFIPAPAALEAPDVPGRVWHLATDGTAAREVASMVTAMLMHGALSPDLNQVAYLSSVGDLSDNRRELRIASIEPASDNLYLTEAMIMFSGWAADSSQFAFSVGEDNRVYLGSVGESPQPLTDAASAFNVQWVDANRFLFTVKNGAQFELRLGRAGEPSQLIAGLPGLPIFDFTR